MTYRQQFIVQVLQTTIEPLPGRHRVASRIAFNLFQQRRY
jgi:hypothetical protein